MLECSYGSEMYGRVLVFFRKRDWFCIFLFLWLPWREMVRYIVFKIWFHPWHCFISYFFFLMGCCVILLLTFSIDTNSSLTHIRSYAAFHRGSSLRKKKNWIVSSTPSNDVIFGIEIFFHVFWFCSRPKRYLRDRFWTKGFWRANQCSRLVVSKPKEHADECLRLAGIGVTSDV